MKMDCVQIEFNDQLKACGVPVQKGMDKKKHEYLLKQSTLEISIEVIYSRWLIERWSELVVLIKSQSQILG